MFRLRGQRLADQSAARRTVEPGTIRFVYSSSFYIDAYRSYQAAATAVTSERFKSEAQRCAARTQLRERRARATWALANGGEESLPFTLQMLCSADVGERDDARGILRQMGCRDQVVDSLITSLRHANDPGTVTSIILALGEMKNTRAIASLGSVLSSSLVDTNTKRLAISSLGNLAQRRFDRSEDPEGAALAWLDANGYGSALVGRSEAGSERVISTA